MSRPSIIVALLFGSLWGCAQDAAKPDSFYRLARVDAEASSAAVARPQLGGAVLVKRFTADGLTGERQLVYTAPGFPNQLYRYSYHFWADSPTRMLQELMVDYLRAANVAELVVTPDHRVDAAYVISGKIRRLEHALGDPHRVVVELEFGVERVGDRALVLIDSYYAERKVGKDGVRGAAEAMNLALAEVYRQFVSEIERKRFGGN